LKKILSIICIFLVFIFNSEIINAENILQGYSLALDEINDPHIRNEIRSIAIDKCDLNWCLYVNNQMISTFNDSEHVTQYITSDNKSINIKVNLDSLMVDFDYVDYRYQSFTAALRLINIENKQYLDFYPNRNDQFFVRLIGIKNDNRWIFPDQRYDYSYQDEHGNTVYFPVNYSFYLDTAQNSLIVEHNNNISRLTVNQEVMVQSIFLETFVNAHPLAIEYLKKDLPMKSFYQAKNVPYSSSLIDQAVANEMLVLKHKESNLTYEVPLRQFLTFWRRISEGNYDTSTTETIQTVCQWHEDVCAGVREHYQDSGRLYAVFGSSYSYDDVDSYDVTELVHSYTTLYKNITWPNDLWISGSNNINNELVAGQMKINQATWGDYSPFTLDNITEDCEDNFDCSYKQATKYSQKSANWGSWSGYSSQYPNECQDNGNCSWESSRFYNKRTGYWNPYSSYTVGYPFDCVDSFDCRWKSLRYYRSRSYSYVGTYSSWKSSCSVTDDHHCSTYYKYTCKVGASSYTRYSTTSYNLFTQGLCGSGYRITGKISGYRYRYINWGSWSSYTTNSCSNVVGYSKCESQLRYATSYRSWGNWTGYNQTSCSNSDVIQCQGPVTYYRQRTKIWSDWTDYLYDSCIPNADRLCQSQTRYAYRYKSWSGWSDWLEYDPNVTPSDNRQIYYRTNQGVITWEDHPGTSNTIGQDSMFLNETKTIDNGSRLVTYELARLSQTQLDTISEMSESALIDLSEQIAIGVKKQSLLQVLLRENDRVLLSNLEEENLSDYNNVGNIAKENFLNSSIFIPYVYVRDHYRAAKKDMEIVGYNDSVQVTNTKVGSLNVNETLSLIENWMTIYRDNKVIFYDHHDPLHAYEELPDNWENYQLLLDELMNAEINDSQITISLNQDDIISIRNYLNSGGYQKMGTCDILVRFSYLINDKQGSFNDWLNSYQGECTYVDSD